MDSFLPSLFLEPPLFTARCHNSHVSLFAYDYIISLERRIYGVCTSEEDRTVFCHVTIVLSFLRFQRPTMRSPSNADTYRHTPQTELDSPGNFPEKAVCYG